MTIQSKASVTHKAKAGAESAGQRLDRFLAGALPDLSRMRLKTLIQSGQVSLNGETITEPSYRVKPGESFTVTVPPAVDATPQAQDIALQIVYEDDALIVVDKPAGLVVHPAPGNPDRTLVNALLAHCGDSLSGIGGVRRPGIVHRLDKDTSGLMVVAKTDAAHAALAAQLADRSLKRTYHAVVWGAPSPRSGTVDRPIGRDPRNRKRMAVVSRGGKEARTHYKVLEAFGPAAEPIAALVECRLETGRTHQIRVHMAALGHPLIGDPLYGRARRGRTSRLAPETRDAVAGFDRQALHATALSFRHPTSGKMLNFQAPPPPDMKGLLGTLR